MIFTILFLNVTQAKKILLHKKLSLLFYDFYVIIWIFNLDNEGKITFQYE